MRPITPTQIIGFQSLNELRYLLACTCPWSIHTWILQWAIRLEELRWLNHIAENILVSKHAKKLEIGNENCFLSEEYYLVIKQIVVFSTTNLASIWALRTFSYFDFRFFTRRLLCFSPSFLFRFLQRSWIRCAFAGLFRFSRTWFSLQGTCRLFPEFVDDFLQRFPVSFWQECDNEHCADESDWTEKVEYFRCAKTQLDEWVQFKNNKTEYEAGTGCQATSQAFYAQWEHLWKIEESPSLFWKLCSIIVKQRMLKSEIHCLYKLPRQA